VLDTAGMAKPLQWDRPEEHDHIVLLADDDATHLELVKDHLLRVAGRQRAPTLGKYPRFGVLLARDGEEAVKKAGPKVTVAAVDLRMPRRNGLEVIQELRAKRHDLAILAFTAGAPASEAVAAVMAGADFFHESRDEPDPAAFERALELAIDRRRLTRLIEKNQEEVEQARDKLALLSGDLARALPGFRPPQAREDVLPFKDAARRYLLAGARLFEGDGQGLAKALGVSYFALRRLLAKYDVPLPSRSRKQGTANR
jgi:CheY-like chemotaxis protein